RFGCRAGQTVERNRVPVVVQEQDRRFLDDQPGDVIEPEIGTTKQSAGAVQVEPVQNPPLAEQVAQVASPQVGERQVAQQLHRGFRVAAVKRRAVQVILVEQADVSQEDQLAVLEQKLSGRRGPGLVVAAIDLRHQVVG